MPLDLLSSVLIFGLVGVTLAVLLTRRAGIHATTGTSRSTQTIVTGLAAINLTAMLGLAWFAATMLYYDGVMVVGTAALRGRNCRPRDRHARRVRAHASNT